MKANFKKNQMQLCTVNNNLLFISKEDWTSDEINNDKYNIEFFDVVEVEETGWNENFPSELFFKVTLENGDILNVAGQWYNENTVNVAYEL